MTSATAELAALLRVTACYISHAGHRHSARTARGASRYGFRDFPREAPEAERIDLRAVEAAEKKAFAKQERRRAAAKARERDGPGAGERIMGLVHDLDAPRVVRDYDAELAGLLRAAHAQSMVGGS